MGRKQNAVGVDLDGLAGGSVADVPLRLEYRSPQELAENPANWRTHPMGQINALTDVIAEVGWAGACLFNERTGRLIDGHARRKVALEQGASKVPVLIGSWSEEDERKILATLDPLAAMAEADTEKMRKLCADIETDSDAVQAMLDGMLSADNLDGGAGADEPAEPQAIHESYQVLIKCDSESEQLELLERLQAEGLECRSLIS